MRTVRQVTRYRLAAAVAVTLSCGCAAGSRLVYPGAVAGSRAEVPAWVDSARLPCGPADTCVVGVSRCAPQGPASLDAARMSGYARLASMAFPVEVAAVWKDYQTVEFSGGRETARTTLNDDVRTELAGRVRGAAVVDEYWARRRVHGMAGVTDCYDGWSLLSIPTTDLGSLYPRELERSALEVARISAELAPIEEALTLAAVNVPGFVPRALSVFCAARSSLAGVQQVDGLNGLTARLAAAEASFGSLFSFEVKSLDSPGLRLAAEATVEVSMAGSPQPGLNLVIDGCGLQGASVTTDRDGRFRVSVMPATGLSGCAPGVRFAGVMKNIAVVNVPPLYSGYTLSGTADATGRFGPRLADSARRAIPDHRDTPSRNGSQTGRPPVAVRLAVTVRAGDPAPYNGRVMISTGEVMVEITGRAEGRQVVGVEPVRRELRAVGVDEAGIAAALESQMDDAIREAVSRVEAFFNGVSQR